MKEFLVALWIVFIVCMVPSCAGTADKAAAVMNAFAYGHEKIQQIADSTQVTCQKGHDMLVAEGADTADLDKACNEIWDLIKEYKNLTDNVLKMED